MGTSGTTSFSSGHDTAGDLTSQTDGNSANPATGYGYDQLGRKIGLSYADGTTEQWHYDASGNVSSYKNRAGNTQTYNAYDGRNRPTGWSWTNTNPASTIGFDVAGRCTSMNNGYSALVMAYDDSNALLSEQQNISGASAQTVSYAPDADGNVTGITYPSGETASWPGLDYLGRVQQVEATLAGTSGATLLASCGYSDSLLSYTATLGSVYNAFGYQANNRINATSVYHASGQNISNRGYGYYPNGQMSWFQKNADNGSSGSALENGKGEYFYTYNNGGLTYWGDEVAGVAGSANAQGDSIPASASNATHADYYQYDNAGNRTYDDESGGVNQPTFDGENRQAGLSYDANGNTASQSWNNATYSYAFDALNQLTSASGGGNSASFVYDPKGRLCQRTVNGVITRLYYAGNQLIQENDGSDNKLNTYYYYGLGGALASRVSNTNYKIFWEYDARGFLTHLTNGPGNVIEQYLYHSFGTPYIYDATGTRSRGQTSAVLGGNRYLWAQGYEWYPEIGLYRCGARFYSPSLGRFMQPDPIGQGGGLNIYSYCQNDPINGSDPSGLFLQSLGDGVFIDNGLGANGPGTTLDFSDIGTNAQPVEMAGATPSTGSSSSTGGNNSTPPEPVITGGGSLGATNGGASGDTTGAPASFGNYAGAGAYLGVGSVGAPGFWGSMIPFYGNGRSAINAFQTGHPWQGMFYSAMAASDVFIVKSLVVGIAKGAVIVGGKLFVEEAAENAPKVFSEGKQALVEMAKADKRIGMTKADMETYKDLNKELPDPFPANKVRGPESHSSGLPSSRQPHGHVGPVDHIPILDAN